MKVLFSQDFKEELARFDGNAKITRYVLEQREVKKKSGWLAAEDFDYSKSNVCYGIWDKENLSLKIYIDFPEEYIVNKSTYNSTKNDNDFVENENSFNVIRFFYGSKKSTAFILVNDETGTKLSFSQSRNLIDVPFPSNTVANVSMQSVSQDVKFLEGSGLGTSSNLFQANKTGLVELNSYYKYLLVNTTEDTDSVISPYLDAYGKRIADNYKYRIYSNLQILISDLTEKASLPYVRYGLNKDGGEVYFHGFVDYTEYLYKQGEITKLCTGTTCADEVPGMKIVCVSDTNLIHTIHNQGLYLTYGAKKNDYNCTADFKLSFQYYDPLSDEIKTLLSDPVRLTQQEENLDWNVVDSGTTYVEDSCPLYLFEYDANTSGETKHLKVHTYLGMSTSDIKYVFPSDEYKSLVKFTATQDSANEATGERVYDIAITLNSDNTGTTWFPGRASKTEELPKISITYETYNIDIIVIQKANLSGLELGRIPGTGINDYDIVHSIYFSKADEEDSVSNAAGLILTVSGLPKDNTDESVLGEYSWWKTISVPDSKKIIVKSSETEKDYGHLSYGLSSSSSRQFNISSSIIPVDAYDKSIGSVIFRRISEDEIATEFSTTLTWEEETDSKRLTIPMTVEGNPISMTSDLPEGDIVFSRDSSTAVVLTRIKKINVKSNCKFRCNIVPDSDFNGDLYFYNTNSKRYESDSYSLDSGIDFYLVYENNPSNTNLDSCSVGTFIISAAVDGKSSVIEEHTISVGELSKESILPISEINSDSSGFSRFMFLGSYDEASRLCTSNIIPKVTTNKILAKDTYSIHTTNLGCSYTYDSGTSEITNVNCGFKVERETSITESGVYPVPLDSIVNVSNNYRNLSTDTRTGQLNYYVFPKTNSPKIELYTTSGETLLEKIIISNSSSDTSYYNAILKSRYKLFTPNETSDKAYQCYITSNASSSGTCSIILSLSLSSSTRDNGWYEYDMKLSVSNYSGFASGSELGKLILNSSIIPPSEARTESSVLNYVVSNFTDNVVNDEDKYIVEDTFVSWINETLGTFSSSIPIILSSFPPSYAGVTITGPRDISISPASNKLSYSIFPQVELNMSNFTTTEGISSLDGDIIMNMSSQTTEYNIFISSYIDAMVKSSEFAFDNYSGYLGISKSRDVGYTTRFKGIDGNEYRETFSITQRGIIDALFLWIKDDSPKLYVNYVDDGVITVDVDLTGDTRTLELEAGLVNIESRINNTSLDINSISLSNTGSNEFTYDISTESDIILKTSANTFTKNIEITLPSNTTDSIVLYKATIKARGLDTDHTVELNIKHHPGKARFYSDDEVYFYSNGDIFNLIEKDVGWFYFESDIPVDTINTRLKLEIVDENEAIITPAQDIIISEALGRTAQNSGCTSYKANIALDPNYSDSTIEGYIKIYQTGKETTTISEPVKFMQGNYCVMIQELNSDSAVINEIYGTPLKYNNPSLLGPYESPAVKSTGEDVILYIEKSRTEPDGYGSWKVFSPDSCKINIDSKNRSLWTVANSEIPIDTYLKDYYISLDYGDDQIILRNYYTVKNSSYAKQEIYFNIRVRITADYPSKDDPDNYIVALASSSLTMDYIVQLKKIKLVTS